jgi:hypothetical protein
MLGETIARGSEIGHLLKYAASKLKGTSENGVLIISTDVDVGNPQLGILNQGKRDNDVNYDFSEFQIGEAEENCIPAFIEMFDNFEIPITFAVRGQLTEVGGKVLDCLLNSKVKHDIGAHGYYHTMFTKISREEADEELKLISEGMKKYNLIPKTFIFPRNAISHLDLLEKYKYVCYRSLGGLFKDRMRIERTNNLYNICPSICINNYTNPLLLRKLLNIAIKQNLPLHIWFHFWNFGNERKSAEKNLQKVFVPFLKFASAKSKSSLVSFETMLSAAQKYGAQK